MTNSMKVYTKKPNGSDSEFYEIEELSNTEFNLEINAGATLQRSKIAKNISNNQITEEITINNIKYTLTLTLDERPLRGEEYLNVTINIK